MARRDVSDTDELPQILWYVAGQSTVRQDGNLVVRSCTRRPKLKCIGDVVRATKSEY